MLRLLLLVSGLSLLAACSSQAPQKPKSSPIKDTAQLNNVALSHVRAYLLIGNIEKAEQRFQTINQADMQPEVLLTLAELRAAKGDDLGAQQAFIQSTQHSEFGKQLVATELLDYFCAQNKWPMLLGYATAMASRELTVSTRNQQLTNIGLCLFRAQHLSDAYKLLSELDFNQPIEPFAYLALARLSIEQQQTQTAQQLMDKFEVNKTQVDPEILWLSFEVYSYLQKPQLAQQAAQQLLALFPSNSFTRKYLILTKRNKHVPETVVKPTTVLAKEDKAKPQIHLIKKGETLYQLSKRYNVTVAELLKWNPNLVIDDISLGTPIQVSE